MGQNSSGRERVSNAVAVTLLLSIIALSVALELTAKHFIQDVYKRNKQNYVRPLHAAADS